MTSSVGTRLFGSLGVVVLAVLALSAAPGTALAQSDVTFTKDVLPILQDSCQTCHREGAIAPMSLMTYEETRPWARAIREKVVTRTMPPWYIDKNIGVQGFKYDRSLNDAQIRHRRRLGRRRRAARQPGRRAAGARVRRPRPVAHRRARLDRPDSGAVPRAGRGRQLVGRLLRRLGPDRGRLDQRGRDEAVVRGLPGGAPRGHPRAGDARGYRGRLPQRVRPGQERRHLPARNRPPRQGRHRHPPSTCTTPPSARIGPTAPASD